MLFTELDEALVAQNGWVTTVNVASYMKPHPEDKRQPKAQRPLTEPQRSWVQVLGVDPKQVSVRCTKIRSTEPNQYGYVSNHATVELISPKPFVVVGRTTETTWLGDYAPLARQYGIAKNMHRGVLGQELQLKKMPVVLRSSMKSPDFRKDGRYVNWVSLAELAQLTRMGIADVIRGFAGFSPSSRYEPNVPLLKAERSKVAEARQEDILRVYVTEPENSSSFCGFESWWGGDNIALLDDSADMLEHEAAQLWVPEEFAVRVMQLLRFGFNPQDDASNDSFTIEAPLPTAPQLSLPVLTEEGLKDLRELYMERTREMPRPAFRQAAQNALGLPRGTKWRDAAGLDDGGSMRYHTGFALIDTVIGDYRVVVADCDWSRGGHEPGEYYAGLLVVLPKDGDIIETVKSGGATLQAALWPSAISRTLPIGSVGGFCPPEVPAECMPVIQRFLLELGYDE